MHSDMAWFSLKNLSEKKEALSWVDCIISAQLAEVTLSIISLLGILSHLVRTFKCGRSIYTIVDIDLYNM